MEEKDYFKKGWAVLIQNSLGIFYGKLKEFNAEQGTALLKDGYMLPKTGYISLKNETHVDESARNPFYDCKFIPMPTITDLAGGGLYMIASCEIPFHTSVLLKASLIPVGGILAIVPIDEKQIDSFEKPRFYPTCQFDEEVLEELGLN